MKIMLDVHTHNPLASDAIISVEPRDFAPLPGRLYSVGIHPWSEHHGSNDIALLKTLATHPQVAAIGECGIDLVRSTMTVDTQTQLTLLHARLAEDVKKPLVIHCVRASHIIAKLLKEFRPSQPWIIHGFRGNAHEAQALLRFPTVWLSFGEHFNPKSLEITPPSRRLAETDCSTLPLAQIAAAISPATPSFFTDSPAATNADALS